MPAGNATRRALLISIITKGSLGVVAALVGVGILHADNSIVAMLLAIHAAISAGSETAQRGNGGA